MFCLKLKSLVRPWECSLFVHVASLFSHGFVMRAEEQETNMKVQPQLYSHRSPKNNLSFARIKRDLCSRRNVGALQWRPVKHLDFLGLK